MFKPPEKDTKPTGGLFEASRVQSISTNLSELEFYEDCIQTGE